MSSPTDIQFEEARRSFEAVRAKACALQRDARDLGRQVCEAREALAGVVEVSVRIRASMRTPYAAERVKSLIELKSASQSSLFKALTAAGPNTATDLDDLTDGVIAAYRDAVAQDDDQLVALLGGLLREIGRHLAERVGPRAAGVLLS